MLMDCKKFSQAEGLFLNGRHGDGYYRNYDLLLAICRIELGNYFGAMTILETSELESNVRNHYKGYCLYKLGKIDEGKTMMLGNKFGHNLLGVNGRGDKDLKYTSKYFLETFPEYKSDRTIVTTQSWN
jgi:hypothetical protein